MSRKPKNNHTYASKSGTLLGYATMSYACYIYIYIYIYTWGDPKIPGIVKKMYLKYLYKFETLLPFEVLPPATGYSNPSTAPNAGNIV